MADPTTPSKFNMWHPFQDMSLLDREITVVRGEGVWVYDLDGNRYLDAGAALWYANVGWGRHEIADAVAEQMRRLPSFGTFGQSANLPALELVDRLIRLAPVPNSKVLLTSGGSESIDTAIKLTRRYWQVMGQPERTHIITRQNAYHGMAVGGTSIGGIEPNVTGYGELLRATARVAWDDPEALILEIERIGSERVAAFILEPVIGAGGILFPPDGYYQAVRRICDEMGILLIADEVINGFGRVGDWFASQRFELAPDLITFAKGVSSGYTPVGGVIVAPRVWEPFWDGRGGAFRSGFTYGGHAAACAGALANLDIMEREHLHTRARDLELELPGIFQPLLELPLVTEIRCKHGLLLAVQLDTETLRLDPVLRGEISRALIAQGVLTRILACDAIQVSPALSISLDELRELSDRIGSALERVTVPAAR